VPHPGTNGINYVIARLSIFQGRGFEDAVLAQSIDHTHPEMDHSSDSISPLIYT
jgi:hypothetical protein